MDFKRSLEDNQTLWPAVCCGAGAPLIVLKVLILLMLFLSASNIDSGKGANTQKVWLSLQLAPLPLGPLDRKQLIW